ncbi:MAG: ABC transporter ATP-binding protein [Chitinophagia bacterium]|nr:ABC transporter ATP-binding protein [Chitinophagia bacterium]
MISGINISKQYLGIKVLNDVSIHCQSGQICGLLGANGAGKTTLFKILLGLVTPDSGNIIVEAASKKRIGGIIEKPALYEYLSALDNLRIFASIQQLPTNRTTLEKYLLRVGLPLNRKDPVANFSMGMKQRLGIAIALLNNPSCLILDEPFTGLDPMGVVSLRSLIRQLTQEFQLAVFLSSHILEDLNQLCSRLYVLQNGKLIRQGNTQAIMLECTQQYIITAKNLRQSNMLHQWEHQLQGDTLKIHIQPTQVPDFLSALALEKIEITSCIPQPDLLLLFEGGKE